MTDTDVPFREQDDMRLCPICRMPISVLATKCRHCGGEVARPRRKEANLTIQDLGGDAQPTYTPSGDVIEAIEAFRAEVISGQKADLPGSEPSALGGGSGLPELDARSRDLMQFALSSSTVSSTPPPRVAQQPSGASRLLLGLGVAVATLLCLVFVYKIVEGLRSDDVEQKPTYHNRAPEMMAANGGGLEVLKAALDAVNNAPGPENDQVLNQSRDYFVKEIDALLTADPWDPELLQKASRLTSEGVILDNDARIRDIRQQVLDEVAAYSMFLQVNPEQNTVVYKRSAEATEEEVVGVGDLLGGRFEVLNVTPRQVRLEDTRHASRGGGRLLVYWVERGRLTPAG
ncbi:MAG: hypothetical protein KA184_11235 [Candidatus Hydrogenedentes bacterium]|nr:hypothetical protein [Candidatus Hydrogenedentota bacterium]